MVGIRLRRDERNVGVAFPLLFVDLDDVADVFLRRDVVVAIDDDGML